MRSAVVVLVAMMACYPTTTRPALTPVPNAIIAEWELFPPQAMRALALALDADSIPVSRTEPDDGWLETPWFDAATLQPTSKRPLGLDIVKLRAWAEPSRPNHSAITIEVVYRPLADPSREGRALEQQVEITHPIAVRLSIVMAKLKAEHGGP